MRFALLCWLLAVNAAVASVCKPRQSGGSSTDTSVEIKTTKASVGVPTSIVTSAAEDVTTTDAATSIETSTETAPSTTTIVETTMSDITGPLGTFVLAAKVEGTVSEELSGAERDGAAVFWPSPRVIAAVSTYALHTGDGTSPNGVKLCSTEWLENPAFGVLSCEQTDERKVTCTAPVGQCIGDSDENKVCSSLPGTYDQFYYYRGQFNGIYLGIGPAGNTDEDQHPVELKARRSNK
ncbi:hypothetical protein IL306_004069 [Fusarium sp. DS 682]|nr:hypothetical protein IL306_004069 [Fusarium sp. DS 682]